MQESKYCWYSKTFLALCSYWLVAVWLYKYFLVTASRFYFIFIRYRIEIYMMRICYFLFQCKIATKWLINAKLFHMYVLSLSEATGRISLGLERKIRYNNMLNIFRESYSHFFLIFILLPSLRGEIVFMNLFFDKFTARLVNVINIFMKIGHLFLIIVIIRRTSNYQFL